LGLGEYEGKRFSFDAVPGRTVAVELFFQFITGPFQSKVGRCKRCRTYFWNQWGHSNKLYCNSRCASADTTARVTRERRLKEHQDKPEHYVFPACENLIFDPSRPQKSWRTAWRKLVRETARRAGREAARGALDSGRGLRGAITAWKRAAAPFRGLRFHDLRHQAITEMADAGASDATLMAIAGHTSRQMMEHYSHARMAAKRTVLDKLESGLMGGPSVESERAAGKVN
jgi:hypothetical protein